MRRYALLALSLTLLGVAPLTAAAAASADSEGRAAQVTVHDPVGDVTNIDGKASSRAVTRAIDVRETTYRFFPHRTVAVVHMAAPAKKELNSKNRVKMVGLILGNRAMHDTTLDTNWLVGRNFFYVVWTPTLKRHVHTLSVVNGSEAKVHCSVKVRATGHQVRFSVPNSCSATSKLQTYSGVVGKNGDNEYGWDFTRIAKRPAA